VIELIAATITTSFIILIGRSPYFRYDEDKSYYPTILIFIALLYVLFAFMDGTYSIIIQESIIALIFVIGALIGSVTSLIWIVILLIMHGVYDFCHPMIIENTLVPNWWPLYCLYVDVLLGIWILYTGRVSSENQR
jgi:hypothetical protein